jgi:hypothetical protein
MVLGRTNKSYDRTWVRPIFGGELDSLLDYLGEYEGVIDATAMPAILGARLTKPRQFMIRGGLGLPNAGTASQSADSVGGEIIEALSSTLQTSLEFFLLRIREPLEEHQIEGALGALDEARGEGLIHHLGIAVESPAALPIWQLNDGFDIVLVSPEGNLYVESKKLAVARRVGLVVDGNAPDDKTTQILTYANRP